ncbi:hypothetical protein Cni_G20216 [Canna indica]|uniref:DUF4283 domain-containing protein n=1 Tax=Canna indica TaxID=4628 RepID=A0AAQ3KQX5_9LILI|nr:hypothetical protein Cni_G20216 [Canna indica]
MAILSPFAEDFPRPKKPPDLELMKSNLATEVRGRLEKGKDSSLIPNQGAFEAGRNLKGDKINKIQESAKDKVKIDDAEIKKAREDCKLVLYRKFFGRTPALEMVRNIIPKIRKLKASCKIADLAAGYFAFKFENDVDY